MEACYSKTKILAFVVAVLLKVVTGREVSENEIQSLENIEGDRKSTRLNSSH